MSVSVADGVSATLVQPRVYRGSVAPTLGSPGDLWTDTSAVPVIKICTDATPTWTVVSGGGGGTPGGADTQVQYNDAATFGGDSSFTFNKTTKTVSLAAGTITASAPSLDITQTWNNAGVLFNAINLDITETASTFNSTFLDLKNGGVSKFTVTSLGIVKNAFGYFCSDNIGLGAYGGWAVFIDANKVVLPNSARFSWSNTASGYGGTEDTALARNAAGIVEINNGTAGVLRDLTLRNFTASGTSNLGAVGSVTITGGSAGQFLQTNGSGVLSFATAGGGVSQGKIYAHARNWAMP